MEDKIIEIVAMAYNVPKDSVTPETSFADDLPVGSVHKVGIISILEDDYDMELSIRDLDGFATVGDLIAWASAQE